MVLRLKPDALISVLPTLTKMENTKYQGHDKVPLITWMVAQ
ncbi:transmembrane protein 214-A, partial [Trifolium medium]|nr:transmembrane protein 214-A [Trifolium medium]